MPNTMADRRVDPRYPIILKAEVTELSSGDKIIGRTSDLSRTGCYVDTVRPFASGSTVHVRLMDTRETFEVQGTVRYVSPGLGMGVQFQDQIPTSELATLNEWLNRATKQPA